MEQHSALLRRRKSRKKKKLYIVLPAFNEALSIAKLLDCIDDALYDTPLDYKVIVVNDGSTDKTGAILKKYSEFLPIQVVTHDKNMGLGATIRDGFIAAKELSEGRDIIITMDADDTHTPGLILRMVRMISEGHDVVIASRYQPGSRTIGVPVLRRFLSYGASILFRVIFPTPGIKDFTCGYRAYKTQVIEQAISFYGESFLDQDGFQCMVDIILKLRNMNVIFGEVPFILRYDKKEGETKMQLTPTIINTLKLIFARKFVN